MRAIPIFGLVALLPVIANAAPAAASLVVPICTGDGQDRSISLPLRHPAPGKEQSACCTSACHSGPSRKRLLRDFDPSQ